MEQILQVETDNVLDHKFARNDEVKALTGEIFATFRDIIRLNSLYKDSIQSMLDTGTQVSPTRGLIQCLLNICFKYILCLYQYCMHICLYCNII